MFCKFPLLAIVIAFLSCFSSAFFIIRYVKKNSKFLHLPVLNFSEGKNANKQNYTYKYTSRFKNTKK